MSKMTMDKLLEEETLNTLEPGDIIEGTVVTAYKREVWLDLGPYGLGLIARRELSPGHGLKKGDKASVSVIEPDSDYGFAILSMKKIAKEKGWDILQKYYDEGEMFEVQAYDANRGGLLVEVEGIRGFLPVSQLSSKHYPRVGNADKDQILQKLNELTKEKIKVRILDFDREDNKLILSEKAARREETKKRLEKLEVGSVVKGTVTGTVDFGIFVSIDGIEGLVHISEISWDRVSNPSEYVKQGDEVEAKVIAIDGEKLSLSMKQLEEDPWLAQIKDYKPKDKVEGKVTRVTPFGAFIQITPAIEALVHVSELSEEADPAEFFKVGETRTFSIIDIDTDLRKMSLGVEGNSKK
ncbi:MAG: S1 RNA-binding domain-containing protein [Candidatus Saccharimonadales bacterium]